ncbi:MAG: hypothetical protein K8W52_17665 [Deltaproteobacteria bacterium]|nr:hypothetical protein [Deltaproteobacteria bacterium]
MRSLPLLFLLGASLVGCDAASGPVDPADVPFNAKNPFDSGAPERGDTACAIDFTPKQGSAWHGDVQFDAAGHRVREVITTTATGQRSQVAWTWTRGHLTEIGQGDVDQAPRLIYRYIRNDHGALLRTEVDGDYADPSSPPDGKAESAADWTYDARGLPLRVEYDDDGDGDTTPDQRNEEFVFDDDEHLVQHDVTDVFGTRTTTLTYDSRGLLVGTDTDDDGDGLGDYFDRFAYDGDNRLVTHENRDGVDTYSYLAGSDEPVHLQGPWGDQSWQYHCDRDPTTPH